MKYKEYEVALKRIKEFEEITKYKQIADEVLEKLDSNNRILIKFDFGDCQIQLNLSSDDEQEHFIKKEMYCAFRNIKNKLEEMLEEI
ncbi:hypothetical protein [Clostridioides difficile]|uniref:Uncharacterized protein n=1 Tax=Clostridioides difficile TaxID=1496 RepID=A0A9P3YV16_CLODI|nr:hypothetical protein [Clostridioides difficile]AXU74628.1 hypothetical protein CDIF28670_01015 [Clostridioides difficile]EGT2197646.1 hypothetical protein [Clostridioides difficile]EGT4203836.1 hypothetical protein [Clostridioides difficile]EGT4943486.1 hypothetical protein [Clostridioides difficile]EQI78396.1 hypothetical protein QQI_2906 [Clostridioides difficile Y401]